VIAELMLRAHVTLRHHPAQELSVVEGRYRVDMRPLLVTPVFQCQWPVSGGTSGKNR